MVDASPGTRDMFGTRKNLVGGYLAPLMEEYQIVKYLLPLLLLAVAAFSFPSIGILVLGRCRPQSTSIVSFCLHPRIVPSIAQ